VREVKPEAADAAPGISTGVGSVLLEGADLLADVGKVLADGSDRYEGRSEFVCVCIEQPVNFTDPTTLIAKTLSGGNFATNVAAAPVTAPKLDSVAFSMPAAAVADKARCKGRTSFLVTRTGM
jgi:hypothetical protein